MELVDGELVELLEIEAQADPEELLERHLERNGFRSSTGIQAQAGTELE